MLRPILEAGTYKNKNHRKPGEGLGGTSFFPAAPVWAYLVQEVARIVRAVAAGRKIYVLGGWNTNGTDIARSGCVLDLDSRA